MRKYLSTTLRYINTITLRPELADKYNVHHWSTDFEPADTEVLSVNSVLVLFC
jgi:hypothetical protein